MSPSDITVTATAATALFVEEIEITIRRGAEVVSQRLVPPGEYLLGSDEQAGLRIEVLRVAPQHARLTFREGEIFIEDLGSDEGTFLDGQRITGKTGVRPTQKIQLGEATVEAQRRQSPQVRLAPELQNAVSERRVLPEGLLREKKYEIGAVVAEGGMGKILNARDAFIRRNVAMKVMLKDKTTDHAARFYQEAQITGQLEHPGIVPIYELGVDEQEELFYTMKFVRGITLRRILQLLSEGDRETLTKFPLAALLTAFQKVCDAIAFAHSRQVIHRDLKPDNIMLGDFGEVLVMDWGLAKVIGVAENLRSSPVPASARHLPAINSGASGEGASMTLHGAIMGTPQYMSPEQARGEIESLDGRSDIYALGAILYQILTLQPAVKGGTVRAMLEQVRRGRITPPAALVGTAPRPHLPGGRVPESLGAVCMQALAPTAAARYARVEELQREIEAYQNGFATNAERASLLKLIYLAVCRHKTETAILSGSLLLLLGLGVFAFHHVQRERDIAQNERNVAKTARDRAETTLDQLRATAPTFLEQARALVEEGSFDRALEKIAFAISLQPSNPDYLIFRANLLQSSQRLAEAAPIYRRVLALHPGHAVAAANLTVCDQLLAADPAPAPLSRASRVELLEALMAQGRGVEAAPLALELGEGREAVEEALRARLKEYQSQIGWMNHRIKLLQNGMFSVNLNGLKLGNLDKLLDFPIRELDLGNTGSPDLEVIARLPITRLSLNYNRITDLSPIRHLRLNSLDLRSSTVIDLSPLAGMPLEALVLDATRVSDLTPLKGMPLKMCSLRNTYQLRDISPLADLPLRELDLLNSSVRDLSPLRGMSLHQLSLSSAMFVEDFSPIYDCPNLEELALPFHAVDIPLVGHFPHLRRVSVAGWASEFVSLAKFRKDVLPDAAPYLQLLGVIHAQLGRRPPPLSIRREPAGQFSAYFGGLPIRDLRGLEGLPLSRLDLSRTQVRDLEPLRGMPLRSLRLDGTPATDVAALASLAHLEDLVLPAGATNVDQLRKLPKLRHISKSWNESKQLPAESTQTFWAASDARHGAPK